DFAGPRLCSRRTPTCRRPLAGIRLPRVGGGVLRVSRVARGPVARHFVLGSCRDRPRCWPGDLPHLGAPDPSSIHQVRPAGPEL
ncbi:MAG: ATP synthase protein I, partial [uncultured Nocardioidaceae bacterium]